MSSGGSPKNQTVTQTNNPPDYVQPYLQGTANEAAALYRQGPNTYFPGSTVVPFSSQTQGALDATQQRATEGSPVNRASAGYTADVLNGKYLNSNPYVDQMFSQAAQGTQTQLASQFAGSGRNADAAMPARADQLNQLATQIYGGNYATERALQNSTLSQANSIANQDYIDLQNRGQVGAAYDDLANRQMQDQVARYDYNQQAPGIALDQYIARLNNQAGSSVSSSTPIYTNTLGNVLGGAATGQQIGSNIGSGYGGWGAAIGGIAGLLQQ